MDITTVAQAQKNYKNAIVTTDSEKFRLLSLAASEQYMAETGMTRMEVNRAVRKFNLAR